MPKIRYESDGSEFEDSGFDPVEPIKRHRGHRDAQRTAFHSLYIPPKRIVKRKLYAAERSLGVAHSDALRRGIEQTFGSSKLPGTIADRRLSASILNQQDAKMVFGQSFIRIRGGSLESDVAAVDGFNETLTRYAASANSRRDQVTARLGELGVFDSQNKNKTGMHSVGVDLTGLGYRELAADQEELTVALNDSKFCIHPVIVLPNPIPYIGFAEASSPEAAQTILDKAGCEGLMEAVREQLAEAGSRDGIVMLGRVSLGRADITLNRA